MMEKAVYRAHSVSPPSTLQGLRPSEGREVVLFCSAKGCSTCSRFQMEERDEYEEKHFRGVAVVDWDCSHDRRRILAEEAGVTRIPSYVRISSSGPPEVRFVG